MVDAKLHYTISMRKPSSHYFEVTIKVTDVDKDELRFTMPVWTPGSYLVREFARNVLDFQVFDADNRIELATSKISKNTWVVKIGGSRSVVARYLVYAFEYTVDTSYLDDLHAVINGCSVFMFVEGLEKERILLSIDKNAEWKVISTGLEAISSIGSLPTFEAQDFDTLVDSPIEVGNQTIHTFQVKGVNHDVSIYSKRAFDKAAFVSDLKKIAETTVAVIGQIPYRRYAFLIDFTDEKNGGLEHLNSTHCMASFYKLEPQQEYKQMLSLFSHEFFHAWNAKRMRPEGLGPFNYSSETYTKSLWVAEGITSYYDDLLIRRSGIYTVPDYLDAFCSNVNLMVSLTGSKWQSAEGASFDSWIKHYRPNENSLNALCSYYTQGAIIGWMLDLEIIRSTGCKKNLDDVMRLAYERTYLKKGRGYRDEEFEAACNEVAGGNITTEIYEKRVKGKQPVEFQRYLAYAGLKLIPKSRPAEQGFLGVKIKNDTGRVTVTNTLIAAPAEIAGISVGDELIGIDGMRVDSARLGLYLSNRKPGTRVRITTARDGALKESWAQLSAKPGFEYRIVKNDSATQSERDVFKAWLRAEWSDELKYEDYPPSPLRKQVFDFV